MHTFDCLIYFSFVFHDVPGIIVTLIKLIKIFNRFITKYQALAKKKSELSPAIMVVKNNEYWSAVKSIKTVSGSINEAESSRAIGETSADEV